MRAVVREIHRVAEVIIRHACFADQGKWSHSGGLRNLTRRQTNSYYFQNYNVLL